MISGIGALNGQFGIGLGSGVGGIDQTDAATTARNTIADFGGSFTSLLSDAATDTIGALQKAETVSLQALQGNAETRDVVDAVMNAEQSLQAAIAIRDKIVTAYLEVSRMAI